MPELLDKLQSASTNGYQLYQDRVNTMNSDITKFIEDMLQHNVGVSKRRASWGKDFVTLEVIQMEPTVLSGRKRQVI